MIVANSNELIKYAHKKTAVALGSFDAIHKGHIAIISAAVSYAKENDMLSVVQLFKVPPAVIGGAKAINTLDERLAVIEDLGADIVVVENFDDEFKNIEYTEFVTSYLKNRYNCGAVVAGGNYHFGHFAKGDVKSLVSLGKLCDIDVKILKCIELDGVISSTRIRECIASGKVEKVQELMSRPYRISGEVVHGNSLGNSIGFPTANIDIPEGKVTPYVGVYESRIHFDGKAFRGITNVGAKPTVGCNKENIETHILNFEGNLYGKVICVEFLKRIRDTKKFESLQELKAQLEADIKYIG